MKLRNHRSAKNFQRKGRPVTIEMVAKREQVRKFKKWTVLIKGGGTLAFMVAGYFICSLPGILLGGVLGYQLGKFVMEKFKIKDF